MGSEASESVPAEPQSWNGDGRRQDRVLFDDHPRHPPSSFQIAPDLPSGPLTGIHESMCDGPVWQSANLWPEDRSWCIANGLELRTSHRFGPCFSNPDEFEIGCHGIGRLWGVFIT